MRLCRNRVSTTPVRPASARAELARTDDIVR